MIKRSITVILVVLSLTFTGCLQGGSSSDNSSAITGLKSPDGLK